METSEQDNPEPRDWLRAEGMMKLLVAIDTSPVSGTVVNEVANRPWPSGTLACVLHVIDFAQLPNGLDVTQAVQQSADLFVKAEAAKLDNAGLRTTTSVFKGHPRLAIAEYAKEWSADLVVVGSHGASGLARFLLGSVAQETLRRSPCSVEIVRRAAQGSATISTKMKILLAIDGSESSMVAVRSVAGRPWPSGSQIRLISVVPLIAPLGETIPIGPVYYPPSEVLEELQREARNRAEEAVARAHQTLSKAGIRRVEAESMPIGDARAVILDEAKSWGADLIVVGSHGYRGIDRLMLGSVSEAVAIHAHCSVEIDRDSKLTISKESS